MNYLTTFSLKSNTFRRNYDRFSRPLGMAFLFCIPLKLSWSYAALIPFLMLFALAELERLKQGSQAQQSLVRTQSSEILRAFYVFIFLTLVAAPFGLEPLKSCKASIELAFIALVSIALSRIVKQGFVYPLLISLIFGQTLAAFHSMLEGYLGLPPVPDMIKFPGQVTESGQLALTIMVAIGVMIGLRRSILAQKIETNLGILSPEKRQIYIFAALNLCLFSTVGVSTYHYLSALCNNSLLIISLASILFFACFALFNRKISSNIQTKWLFLLSTVCMPLLVSALIINLKRGPWLALLVTCLIFSLQFKKSLIIPVCTVAVLAFATLSPIRHRLFESYEDFNVPGGRRVIWGVGAQLLSRYPLGIGLDNSGHLRDYSSEIPKELKHFHNNFINVVVETGWLGLTFYLYWLIQIVKLTFSSKQVAIDVLRLSLGCALISWQIAGLVEYNFGDSEVLLIALMLLGVFDGLTRSEAEQHQS